MFRPTDFLSSFKWWPVRNQHGTDAPPHAALMVTGVADGCVTVSQPDADGKSPALVLFNGPGLLPAGAEGQATSDPGTRAKYATGDGTPAAGETWGAGAASWELRKGKAGFVAWGGADGGSAVFVPAGGASVPNSCLSIAEIFACDPDTGNLIYRDGCICIRDNALALLDSGGTPVAGAEGTCPTT